MNFDLLLAGLVLAIHLLFILWVIFGWIFTRRRPVWRSLHIGCVIYGIFIEVSNLTCPLTFIETALEARGGETPYHGAFILHYLEILVYPDIPLFALITVAVIVCLVILGIYTRRYRRRTAAGW